MGTNPVIELNSLDNLLIGIEQSTDVFFILDELNVSDDGSSSDLGLVEIVLYLGAFGQALMLPVNVL